jgi:hypothetical protein
MYKVKLPYYMHDCPQWWHNLTKQYEYEKRIGFINDNGGRIFYIEGDDEFIDFIEFPSEAHFHWFLLKI